MSSYAPVPPPTEYVPFTLTVSRHVLGLKCCVPVPFEWVITNVPSGNVSVEVVLLVRVSVPPAVNTP
jgi:hypothetical protein